MVEGNGYKCLIRLRAMFDASHSNVCCAHLVSCILSEMCLSSEEPVRKLVAIRRLCQAITMLTSRVENHRGQFQSLHDYATVIGWIFTIIFLILCTLDVFAQDTDGVCQ